MVRGGSGRGGATRSAKDQGGTARNGRRGRRRRALLGLAPRELEDEEEREEKPETALGRDKLERVSVERRDGRRVEALAGVQTLVGAAYEHSDTGEAQ